MAHHHAQAHDLAQPADHHIILDTDPGIDDSLAILLGLASPDKIRFEALTIIYGNNRDTRQLAQNACDLLEYFGHPEIPVALGASKPLFYEYDGSGDMVHGPNGLGGISLKVPRQKQLESMDAAQLIIDQCKKAPGMITIVAVGPLTNLCIALAREPNLPKLVKRVVIMGGAVERPGNVSFYAEANIHGDPDAAAAVFAAEWEIVLTALNVTEATRMQDKDMEELRQLGNRAGVFVHDVTRFYAKFHTSVGKSDMPFHDPSAMMYLISPQSFETRRGIITVDRSRGETRGLTSVEWREDGRHIVLTKVNSKEVLDIFKNRISSLR